MRRNTTSRRQQAGFTLVELILVLAVSSLVISGFYVFFHTSLSRYLALQKDGSDFTDLSYQSQRIANVMRNITDIVSESADDITCYAYFSPNDNFASLIHYYKANNNTQLLADVTPMTANPPTGTLITAKKKTFKIIPNFYQSPTLSTFTYIDDIGNPLSLPITDEHTIKSIQVNLAVRGANNSDQAVSLTVNLRNRKTNL